WRARPPPRSDSLPRDRCRPKSAAPAPVRAGSRAFLGQELQGIDRLSELPYLEGQLRLGRVGVADLGDLLSPDDVVPLLHEEVAVVCVRGEIGLVVLDDDKLAVAAQARAAVPHAPRRGRE